MNGTNITTTMSIKDLLCDLPEELADLLYEQFDNCDYDLISIRNELAETKAALAALQVKYDKKEHENKILVRGLHHHIKQKQHLLTHVRNISVETASAISMGEQPFEVKREKTPVSIPYVRENYEWYSPNELERNISLDSDTSNSTAIWPIQREVHGEFLDKFASTEPLHSTYVDFNGIEQVRFNDFDRWNPDQWVPIDQWDPKQWSSPSRDNY